MTVEEVIEKTIEHNNKFHSTGSDKDDVRLKVESMAARTNTNFLSKTIWFYEHLFRNNVILTSDFSSNNLSDNVGVVYIANHTSNLDSLILGTQLFKNNFPYPVFAAGSNLFPSKIVDKLFKTLGGFSFDRKRTNGMNYLTYMDLVGSYMYVNMTFGTPILFFPEGTRSRKGALGNFGRGLVGKVIDIFFQEVSSSGSGLKDILVVPIGLNHIRVPEEDYLTKNGNSKAQKVSLLKDYFRFGFRKIPSYIHIGKPISLQNHFVGYAPSQEQQKQTSVDFATYLRSVVSRTIPLTDFDIGMYVLNQFLTESNKVSDSDLAGKMSAVGDALLQRGFNVVQTDSMLRTPIKGVLTFQQGHYAVINQNLFQFYANKVISLFDSI